MIGAVSIARGAGAGALTVGCRVRQKHVTNPARKQLTARMAVLVFIFIKRVKRPNDPSSATRRTGPNEGHRDAPAGFAAAHG